MSKYFIFSKASKLKYGAKCKAFCACKDCLDTYHIVFFGFDVPINDFFKNLFLKLNLN